ncbi:MAG: monovalent cation/H(+) antiporter subunit G [Lachnospiraceae bacterium]|nr:monovalent cation/H(+) antiporter subunit G [Lachnospiraceae bacterium]
MIGWIRFGLTAVFLIAGLVFFAGGAAGYIRFGYSLNRIHAGGLGDTAGLFFVLLALAFSAGELMDILKLGLLLLFMWSTSPTSSHFLSQIEYYTNTRLYDHVEREESKEDENGSC